MVAETDVIEKIQRFIMKRSGLYFKEHDMLSLKDNIIKRMTGLKCLSYEDYYGLLAQSPESHKEFTELLNLLTIKHTHFFRNPDQFAGLEHKVLPEIMERKRKSGDMNINILSAGCSTGEEPYSIAMVLLNLLGNSSPWKVWILTTDISTEALVSAKKGIYSIGVLKHIEKGFVDQYMKRFCFIHRDKVFISPSVKNMVDFQFMNLIDEFYPQGFDIIFCRNVTIYFEIDTVRNIIEKFYQSLNQKGYLFSGGTETLYGISDKFELLDVGRALVYKKVPVKELKRPEEKVWPLLPTVTYPMRDETAVTEEVAVKKELAEEKQFEPAESFKDAHELYEKAKANFIKKEYVAAERLLKDALEIEPHLIEARILLANIFVNQDRFHEAEQECQKAVNIDFLSPEPRYLLGIIHKKKAQYKDALDSLKKAIYLNSDYSMAYFAIAELYRERGQEKDAINAYRNTLKALEQETNEHFRDSSGGFSKKILAQVCVRSISGLK